HALKLVAHKGGGVAEPLFFRNGVRGGSVARRSSGLVRLTVNENAVLRFPAFVDLVDHDTALNAAQIRDGIKQRGIGVRSRGDLLIVIRRFLTRSFSEGVFHLT